MHFHNIIRYQREHSSSMMLFVNEMDDRTMTSRTRPTPTSPASSGRRQRWGTPGATSRPGSKSKVRFLPLNTEVCKIIPACLKIPSPSAARQLDQPCTCTAQSANFAKFWLNSQNLAGTILHHSVKSRRLCRTL